MNSLRALLSLLILGFAAPAFADRPNILWINVDDMSDWVGCYGDEISESPNIDSLADGGIRFENAFMPSPVCSTTRSALITGSMQTSHGLHHHRTMLKQPLPDDLLTVPELFRQAGYLTFNEAKEDYNFVRDRDKMYSPEFKRPGIKGHLVGQDVSWLKQLQGKKFFGQIQLKGGKIGGETGSKYPAESRFDPNKVPVPPQYPDDPVIRNAIARHYEQIAETDDQVGAIIRGLKEYDLWENTAVFFFTDHGSPLPRSKQFLYEEGTKVPLIVHWPGGAKELARTGAVRSDLVSGIDISITSLALAGIEVPSVMEGHDLFAEPFQPRKYVVSARDRCGIAVDRIRSIRSEKFRYIRNYQTDRPLYQSQYRDGFATFETLRKLNAAGKLSPLQSSYFDASRRPAEELYELAKDPHETNNLADDPGYQTVLNRHQAYLREWEEKTDDKGRYPESKESLTLVYKQAKGKCPAPEFDFLRIPPATNRRGDSAEAFERGEFRWRVSLPVLAVDGTRLPESKQHPWVSVKDPSVVRYKDRWHLFCTLRKEKQGDGRIRIGYLSFADWSNAQDADWSVLNLTMGYHGAPQIFYFEPHRKWYLVYQAEDSTRELKYGPCFSTNDDITRPGDWTLPEPLFVVPEGTKAGLDYWVICDESTAHLFFTTLDGRMWRSETAIETFPDKGWSKPVVALQADIFEASHTYKLSGQNRFLTLIEAQGNKRRYFKAFLADRLDGQWEPLAASLEKPVVSPKNVVNQDESWATSYSHGEFIRAGYDQHLEMDANPKSLRLLFQGANDAEYQRRNYGQIPWRLGMLEAVFDQVPTR